MTMTRETKTKVQQAATSTEPVMSASPRQLLAYGRYLPAEIGRKFAILCARPNRTHNRTREIVTEQRIRARRRAGRVRVH